MTATPVLQIRQHATWKDFSVAASWPDGRVEEILGFKSETDANEWIAHKFQAWLDGQDGARKAS